MRNRITMLFAGACCLGMIGAAATRGATGPDEASGPASALDDSLFPLADEPPVAPPGEPDDGEERQAADATGCTCTDNNPCTTDECLNCFFGNCLGGCAHTSVLNGTGCNDGVFCSGVDFCLSGECVHTGDPCPGPDGDSDCSESCNEAAESCTANDPTGSNCDDDVFCNGADTCGNGLCSIHVGDPCGEPLDGDCTDSCDESAEDCTANAPNGTPCFDSITCNGADSCSNGLCSIHGEDSCPPGQVCDEAADECICISDINDDGETDATDLAMLLGAWGPNPGHLADLNNDGVVDASDLALLLGGWGPCV